jgi:hypothetical protein
VVQEQLKLAQGRTLHAELAQCSCNIKDVGTALGVVVGFLSVMDCKRDALGAQLSELQESVCELSADMKRLVGKPVLEALDEQLNERLAKSQQLRSEVYIPRAPARARSSESFAATRKRSSRDTVHSEFAGGVAART